MLILYSLGFICWHQTVLRIQLLLGFILIELHCNASLEWHYSLKKKKSCRMVEAHLTHLIGNLFLLTWCLHINENFHVLFVEKIPISSIYYYCLWIGLWHPVYGLLLAWNSSTISFSPGHLPDLCKCLTFDPYPWEIPLIHVMATLHYCSIIKDL